MKNRLVYMIVTVMLCTVLLAGCGKSIDFRGSGKDNSLSSQGPYSGTSVGVCIYQLSDNFMSLFCDELVNYLISQGFSKDNIIVYGSSNDQAVQLSQVEELISRKVDVLIVNPVNSSVAASITELAVLGGIPLVYINREPGAEEESYWEQYDLDVTYVGCDARQSGIYQGELLLDMGQDVLDINKDGKIQYYMIEGAPENIDAGYRTMYSLSTLQNAGLEMDCLLDEVGNWDMTTANLITAKGIAEGRIPEVVIANNDAMAIGAINAFLAAGYMPGRDVFVVGVDALPTALEKVSQGQMLGTVFNDYISQSHNAADAAIRYLNSEKNEHYIGCEYIKVDASNADNIYSIVSAASAGAAK